MASNSALTAKKPGKESGIDAVYMQIQEHLRKKEHIEAAKLAEKIGDVDCAVGIRKGIGDHEGVVWLMVKDKDFSGAVSYLDKVGKPVHAVRLALRYDLKDHAKYIATKEIFLKHGWSNLDYTPQLADMAAMVGLKATATTIAEAGTRHFVRVNDFYSAVVLNARVGNAEEMERVLKAGLDFYKNGSSEGEAIRALARGIREGNIPDVI